jgi:ABC-type oligopeptide transport system substrate-binding subunit
VGVAVEKAEEGEVADLELRDRLARYSSPRWFLNQFSCSLELGLCSPEADAMVEKSLIMRDPVTKQRLLAEAHAALMAKDIFIPLGAPIRWSLVRGAVSAYRPNRWGLHPLFPLSQPTT